LLIIDLLESKTEVALSQDGGHAVVRPYKVVELQFVDPDGSMEDASHASHLSEERTMSLEDNQVICVGALDLAAKCCMWRPGSLDGGKGIRVILLELKHLVVLNYAPAILDIFIKSRVLAQHAVPQRVALLHEVVDNGVQNLVVLGLRVGLHGAFASRGELDMHEREAVVFLALPDIVVDDLEEGHANELPRSCQVL